MRVDLARTAIMRVRRVLQKSATLITNSGALAIGTIATAGLGFVYWWLAARTFPPEVIGNAAALLSVMGLIGLLGEAGLGTLLIGEIVRHPGKERGLVAAAVSVGVMLTVGLGLLFIFGGANLVSSSGPIDGWFEGLAFVLGCGLTSLSVLGDQAFVGALLSSGRMIRQVLFSTFKLMLIAAAAAVGYASTGAILLTWVAAILASWIGVDLLTRGRARRLVGVPDFQLLHKHRRRAFGHYAQDVASQAPTFIMPYLVLVLLSPTTNAAFMALWMLVSIASLIPAAGATVLFPVVRASSEQSGHDFLLSLTASLLFSLVCAVFIFAYSQQILAIFNPAYPEIAGSSLRFLGFSLVGSTLKFHASTLARLRDRMLKASPWFALGGLLELGCAVAGAKLGGLEGLVLGWTLAVSIEGACVGLVWTIATKSGSRAGPFHKGGGPSPLQI
ncbi:oligosaccharide flippase family protein [Mesorhizobium sp. M0590]|uniref:lipopolysaccharide biosynthesis protein n=2 Tax=unclassified Mesorhizobium TaxID=325217 RepID=UPI003335A375